MMTGDDTIQDILTVREVNAQLTLYLEGSLTARALAKWAFDHFGDQDEGLLAYEEGQEILIAAILDDLIWADSEPFTLDQEAARRLQHRLNKGSTDGDTH